jgi:pimeloyl-ACP methyl ester carboxylesterase
MFLHGLESSSQGNKARMLAALFPDIVIPDFSGPFDQRMAQAEPILEEDGPWILVGSSFGGLMAASFACQNPNRVARLVLLAPAIHRPEFTRRQCLPIRVPTVLIHGTRDEIVPLDEVEPIARRAFLDLDFRQVDDDHFLRCTVEALDWRAILDAGVYCERM